MISTAVVTDTSYGRNPLWREHHITETTLDLGDAMNKFMIPQLSSDDARTCKVVDGRD